MSTHPGITVAVRKVKGKIVLLNEARYRRQVTTLPEGVDLDMVIAPKPVHRSRQLEKYLWGHVYQVLSEFTGYTRDELHAYSKSRFLTQQTKRIVLADEHGEVKADALIPIEPTTTVLDADTYKAFIWDVRQLAAELGCVTCDPDPEHAFREQPKAKRHAA